MRAGERESSSVRERRPGWGGRGGGGRQNPARVRGVTARRFMCQGLRLLYYPLADDSYDDFILSSRRLPRRLLVFIVTQDAHSPSPSRPASVTSVILPLFNFMACGWALSVALLVRDYLFRMNVSYTP